MTERPRRPLEILLVEDSEADVRLTEIALMRSSFPSKLRVARDGVEALNYLKRRDGFQNAKRPDIVLLDLNLPKLGGAEVLREIRSDLQLLTLPVVILTTSDSDRDIYESFQQEATCYVTKPVDLNKVRNVIEMIEDLWAADSSAEPGEN